MSFRFLGQAPPSKSLLNRALIVKSWFPRLIIEGDNLCDDIQVMKKAIASLDTSQDFYCGLSATAFRFLALRLSRKKGKFLLKGEDALWRRPFKDLSVILSQLGVEIFKTPEGWCLVSQGWQPQGDYLVVPSQVSSQYASALVLNSWNYERDIYFSLTSQKISYLYFKMTIDFVKQLGMEIKQSGKEFYIPKNQTLKKFYYKVEQDQSCLFALAALAVLNGKVVFTNWESKSLQPDSIFLDLLKNMGVGIELKNETISIFQTKNLKNINVDLSGSPDLFPVLSVLCAKAEGASQLSGLSHQAFKESHRLEKVIELLNLSGIQTELKKDTLWIHGKENWSSRSSFSFKSDHDHRMVMAAQLVKSLSVPIDIQGKEAINKSFPDFFSLVGSSL